MNNPLTSTRLFLARVMAWPQEGEGLSFVNLHNTFIPKDTSTLKVDPKTGKVKYPWAGRGCRSLDEAVKAVQYYNQTASTRDVYFCTSTQAFAEKKTTDKGFEYYKAVRASENAVKMKAIFIDSDLVDGKSEEDKDKGYENPKAFVEALAAFLKATGLPKPTIIVASGGGFHMYWTLVRALTIEEWMPLAYALAEATRRHGFKCDTQCTIDAARVLRVPGTKNYKYDPPRPVTMAGNPVEHDYSNEKITAILEPYKVQVPYTVLNASMTILPPKTPIQGMSELAAGIDTSSLQPVKLDSLVFTCGFIAEALATGGQNFQNPLWNLTTLISTFTEGGRADAHRMASGHASYGPGETDELFDRKMEEKVAKNLGWPKCATIKASGCTACAVCPKFIENRSPLNYAEKVGQTQPQAPGGFTNPQPVTQQGNQQPATVTRLVVPGTGQHDPDLPDNYLRTNTGVILYPQYQDDGTATWVPVTHYPMSDPWMQRDPWSLNFTTETEYGKTSQISVPLKDVGTAEMRKALQEQGFMVTGNSRGFALLSDFIMAWIRKLQTTKDSILTSVPFGWQAKGGQTQGFVFGGKLHTPQGEELASNTDPELQRQFSPEGDRLPWVGAAQMITRQGRPALDAILASAFAGPLVRFTGHSGLLMSAFSIESGIGKSTALKIAQAVWGDPVKAVQSLSDTQNSVLNKLGELRSLPIYWDELKSEEDSKKFVDTVFRLTLGKEKSRMTSKVTQRTPGTWQTMMVAASNDSLMDAIAFKTRTTTAGIYRVFEYTVAKPVAGAPGQIDPTLAQRVIAKLHDNYGVIGMEYASYLGSNWQKVEQDMALMLSLVGKEVAMSPDERFWIATIAVVLQGARYANELGFTQINETALKLFMYQTLADMRSQRKAQPVDMRNVVNVVNTLARFINEKRSRNTLMTNIIHRTRGKPPSGTIEIKNDATRLESVQVHIGVDDKIIRIGQSYLYDWLTANNYPRHVFVRALAEELKAINTNGRLGSGTNFAGAAEYIIEIDMKGTPLVNFIDEA